MVCRYCGKQLGLLRKLADQEFCSREHQKAYVQEQEQLVLARLLEARPSNGAKRDSIALVADPPVDFPAEPEISYFPIEEPESVPVEAGFLLEEPAAFPLGFDQILNGVMPAEWDLRTSVVLPRFGVSDPPAADLVRSPALTAVNPPVVLRGKIQSDFRARVESVYPRLPAGLLGKPVKVEVDPPVQPLLSLPVDVHPRNQSSRPRAVSGSLPIAPPARQLNPTPPPSRLVTMPPSALSLGSESPSITRSAPRLRPLPAMRPVAAVQLETPRPNSPSAPASTQPSAKAAASSSATPRPLANELAFSLNPNAPRRLSAPPADASFRPTAVYGSDVRYQAVVDIVQAFSLRIEYPRLRLSVSAEAPPPPPVERLFPLRLQIDSHSLPPADPVDAPDGPQFAALPLQIRRARLGSLPASLPQPSRAPLVHEEWEPNLLFLALTSFPVGDIAPAEPLSAGLSYPQISYEREIAPATQATSDLLPEPLASPLPVPDAASWLMLSLEILPQPPDDVPPPMATVLALAAPCLIAPPPASPVGELEPSAAPLAIIQTVERQPAPPLARRLALGRPTLLPMELSGYESMPVSQPEPAQFPQL